MKPARVITLVSVRAPTPCNRMFPRFETAKILLPAARSSRPSAPKPAISSRAVSVISPAAVMSAIASFCASLIEPSGVAIVTVVPAVIVPIVTSPLVARIPTEPAVPVIVPLVMSPAVAVRLTLLAAVTLTIAMPPVVVAIVTLLPAPFASTEVAMTNPAAVISTEPLVDTTEVKLIPSVSRITMPPETTLLAVRIVTVVSMLMPVAAMAVRLLVVTSTLAVPSCEMEPRSPSAAPRPALSRSADSTTEWTPPPVVTIRPVLKTMSSPASNVSVPATAEFKVTMAALSIVRLSPTNALLPAVKTIDAPTLISALIVKGLFAARNPPPPAVDAPVTLIPPARSVICTTPEALKARRTALMSMSATTAPAPIAPLVASKKIAPLVAERFAVSAAVPSRMLPNARISIAVPTLVFAVACPSVMSPPKAFSALNLMVPPAT